MKALWKCGLGLGLCLALAGCSWVSLPRAHEIERTVLMQALGVDVGTESVDGVAVTASSGARTGAGDSPGAAPVVLSAQADTVTAACTEMQTYGTDYVFYGDVEHVLVGEGQAQRGVKPLLEHMARDPELRLEAQVWCVKSATAADVLFTSAGDGGAAERLAAVEADDKLLSASVPRTARETLVDLERNGCTFLPAVGLVPARPGDGTEGEMAVDPAGYALFRDGALAGWAEGEAAKGIDLLLGRGAPDILELVTPDCARTALRLTGERVSIAPVFSGDTLTGLRVECSLESEAAELRGPGNLNGETRAWLEAELSRVTARRLQAALALLQSLDADCLGLGARAALAAPWRKMALEQQWDNRFSELEVQIEAAGQVARK